MWFRKKTKQKDFDPDVDEYKALAVGRGACMASNRAIRDGFGVSYIFRTKPSERFEDSGWWFVHGTEDAAYMDDPANFKIYDVNTIANFKPQIVPLLDELIGSAFYWDGSNFVPDPQGPPQEIPGPTDTRH